MGARFYRFSQKRTPPNNQGGVGRQQQQQVKSLVDSSTEKLRFSTGGWTNCRKHTSVGDDLGYLILLREDMENNIIACISDNVLAKH